MKICLIVDDYLPDSIKVGAKMMHELACEMKNQGYGVTVITPEPGLNVSKATDYLDGVRVLRFKSGEIKNVNKIKRAINETMLSFRAWKTFGAELRNDRHDLIVYYSPSIFWGGLVSRLKKIWHVPAYLVLRDFFPQWVIDQGLIKKGSLIEKYFRYFETKNYSVADRIGLMSPKNLEWFRHNVSIDKPLEVLYNWASDESIIKHTDYKSKLGLEDKVVYFYGGNMGHAQDMMNLVRLAKRMKAEPQAYFVFVGAGDEVSLIKQAIKDESLDNVMLLPAVSQDEFKQMLVSFDVGLFTLNKNHIAHNFPGKLLGYMQAALPILGSVNLDNDLEAVIANAGAGLVSVNGEDDKLLENAKVLLDASLRKEMGLSSKKLLKSIFSVEATAKQILNMV